MANFEDIWFRSADGLQLHARDYPCQAAPLTLLCMPGLTRNSADFEPLVEYVYPDYRVIAVDLRGRGDSQWDDNPANYHPGTYVQDMFTLIGKLGLERPVLVGTSLGGLMAMIMSALKPGSFSGLIINDAGPQIEPQGLERIQRYVGRDPQVKSWSEAIASTRAIGEIAYPGFTSADWEKLARRIYREGDDGIPQLLYDPAIARPIAESETNAVPPDLWEIFAKSAETPMLVIRGALSDILGVDTVGEMQRRKPDLHTVEVPEVGHAPILDEAPVVGAITSFLASILKK